MRLYTEVNMASTEESPTANKRRNTSDISAMTSLSADVYALVALYTLPNEFDALRCVSKDANIACKRSWSDAVNSWRALMTNTNRMLVHEDMETPLLNFQCAIDRTCSICSGTYTGKIDKELDVHAHSDCIRGNMQFLYQSNEVEELAGKLPLKEYAAGRQYKNLAVWEFRHPAVLFKDTLEYYLLLSESQRREMDGSRLIERHRLNSIHFSEQQRRREMEDEVQEKKKEIRKLKLKQKRTAALQTRKQKLLELVPADFLDFVPDGASLLGDYLEHKLTTKTKFRAFTANKDELLACYERAKFIAKSDMELAGLPRGSIFGGETKSVAQIMKDYELFHSRKQSIDAMDFTGLPRSLIVEDCMHHKEGKSIDLVKADYEFFRGKKRELGDDPVLSRMSILETLPITFRSSSEAKVSLEQLLSYSGELSFHAVRAAPVMATSLNKSLLQ